MKNYKIMNLIRLVVVGVFMLTSLFFVACDDDNSGKYDMTKGVPEVLYIRLTTPELSDSLLVAAYMEQTICLVGNNLTSIQEIYFNDQKAVLNLNFITENTLIVTVPKEIPNKVTDKIYMVTGTKDTIPYDFKVQVPGPLVGSMKCEYVEDGDIAVINGDYFIDDPNKPLEVVFAGNVKATEFVSITKNQIRVRVPAGAQKGYLNVNSIYGSGRSMFLFRDDRGIILDWDNLNASGGWRSGNTADEGGIAGKYVVFSGSLDDDAWNEDGFSFNLWGSANGRPEGDLFDASDLASLQLKFEINIMGAWSSCGMQIVFTPWGLKDTNGYYSDATLGRAVWQPWVSDGSYQTDGWTTVSIPLSDFKYTHTGGAASAPKAGGYGGLSMFVWNGGAKGTPCSPTMWIDNIRVVPIE